MISTWPPERVNKVLGHARLVKVSKKNYLGRKNGFNILCTIGTHTRHPSSLFPALFIVSGVCKYLYNMTLVSQ